MSINAAYKILKESLESLETEIQKGNRNDFVYRHYDRLKEVKFYLDQTLIKTDQILQNDSIIPNGNPYYGFIAKYIRISNSERDFVPNKDLFELYQRYLRSLSVVFPLTTEISFSRNLRFYLSELGYIAPRYPKGDLKYVLRCSQGDKLTKIKVFFGIKLKI